MFNRKKPCKTCPFRTNENGLRFLGEERAQEIVEALLGDQTFTCHDDLSKKESEMQHCAGALLMLESCNRPNQMMRIFERLGYYDRNKLSGQEEVFEDFDEFINAQSR